MYVIYLSVYLREEVFKENRLFNCPFYVFCSLCNQEKNYPNLEIRCFTSSNGCSAVSHFFCLFDNYRVSDAVIFNRFPLYSRLVMVYQTHSIVRISIGEFLLLPMAGWWNWLHLPTLWYCIESLPQERVRPFMVLTNMWQDIWHCKALEEVA